MTTTCQRCRLVEGEVATAGCGCAEDVVAAGSDEWGDDDEHEASEDGVAGEVPGLDGQRGSTWIAWQGVLSL